MIRATSLALTALAATLTGCARGGEAGPETRWRTIASAADRDRLRDWRKTWVAALPVARRADAAALGAQGGLFEPDTALANPVPPAGTYRCRVFRLGSVRAELPGFVALPATSCTIAADGTGTTFTLASGDQRPHGKLYPESDSRAMFLGALELGDERIPLPYGQDARRNSVGYVERIAPARWRLVLPSPGFDTQLDVIELTPG